MQILVSLFGAVEFNTLTLNPIQPTTVVAINKAQLQSHRVNSSSHGNKRRKFAVTNLLSSRE